MQELGMPVSAHGSEFLWHTEHHPCLKTWRASATLPAARSRSTTSITRSWTTSPGSSASTLCASAESTGINQFPQIGNEFPRGQFYFDSQYTNKVTATGGGSRRLLRARTSCWAIRTTPSSPCRWLRPISATSEWATYIDDTWRIQPAPDLQPGLPLGSGAALARCSRPRARMSSSTAASQSGGRGGPESAARFSSARAAAAVSTTASTSATSLIGRPTAELPVATALANRPGRADGQTA